MTTENRLNNTARQSTITLATNQTGETTEQQKMMATDRVDEVTKIFTGIKTEKQKDETADIRKGTMDEKEMIQAAQEKAKEEEEKLSGLWEIRARFKNLAENILPKNPYLMGIPNKIHITTHEGPDWRRGTPFSPHEERVQYVSFQRLDDDETVLRPQSWDEENAKSSQSGSTRRTSSDFSSVPGQTPRKKMSMEEYLRRKKSDSKSANPSQEGGLLPHKAEAKIDRAAKMGSTIKPEPSPLEGTGSKMQGKAMQGGAQGSKTQETAGVTSAGKETAAEKSSALNHEGTDQKEVKTPKEVSVQRENMAQKVSVVPTEGHTGKSIAWEKEGKMEKVVQPVEEGTLPSRKR